MEFTTIIKENLGSSSSSQCSVHILPAKFRQPSCPKWIKEFSFKKELKIDTFNYGFKKVADVNLDVTERGTLISFDNIIPDKEWKQREEYVYIITFDGHIAKIGGTRTGLHGRCGSYLCGHHVPEHGKSGSCSKTNAFVYHTVLHYLLMGVVVELYAYKLPSVKCTHDVFGQDVEIPCQTYHIYESRLLNIYKDLTTTFPHLSINAYPTIAGKS